MPTRIPTKRENTPYLYMALNRVGDYDLFIAIPCKKHENIQFAVPKYTNGTTIITGEVVDDNGQIADGIRAKQLLLEPVAEAGNAQPPYLFSEQFEVRVTITDKQGLKRRTILTYGQSDRKKLKADWIRDQLAHNCPYIYLTNPEAAAGGNPKKYAPRCITFLSGYKLHSQSVMVSSADGGICEQTAILVPDATIVSKDISDELDANKLEYSDNAVVQGSFFAQILMTDGVIPAERLTDPVERNRATFTALEPGMINEAAETITDDRKGRIPNQSSDSNPTGFIN
jgi:hypothetical protein